VNPVDRTPQADFNMRAGIERIAPHIAMKLNASTASNAKSDTFVVEQPRLETIVCELVKALITAICYFMYFMSPGSRW
jgi:hypothetical protein